MIPWAAPIGAQRIKDRVKQKQLCRALHLKAPIRKLDYSSQTAVNTMYVIEVYHKQHNCRPFCKLEPAAAKLLHFALLLFAPGLAHDELSCLMVPSLRSESSP